ncbi:uncharacterized protein LOC124291547 [Haliotis rubra]|uniref:uncharacterized protein LOC124291547 n=1 Tax=Haliotis rubra TaxID=36100 RepID=UPI001EE55C59|nr:uncharacterized protein LOC124291547 [Haliotis rubra]
MLGPRRLPILLPTESHLYCHMLLQVSWGKRDIGNMLPLEQDLKTAIQNAIFTETKGLSNILGRSDLEADNAGSLQQLLESTNNEVKGVETFLTDLKVKRSEWEMSFLRGADSREVHGLLQPSPPLHLTPLTTALSNGLSSLTSGAVSVITHVLSSILSAERRSVSLSVLQVVTCETQSLVTHLLFSGTFCIITFTH